MTVSGPARVRRVQLAYATPVASVVASVGTTAPLPEAVNRTVTSGTPAPVAVRTRTPSGAARCAPIVSVWVFPATMEREEGTSRPPPVGLSPHVDTTSTSAASSTILAKGCTGRIPLDYAALVLVVSTCGKPDRRRSTRTLL